MARKYFSFRSFHRGTVLFEVLLAAVILSLAALAVIPLYTGWRSEKRLELAAEEVASAIRQVEILAKNESADYPSMSEGLTFFCETMTDGTGRYYTRKGTERVNPKGYLPKGIRVDGGKASLRFRKDGFAGTGEEYNIFLTTDNGKYGQKGISSLRDILPRKRSTMPAIAAEEAERNRKSGTETGASHNAAAPERNMSPAPMACFASRKRSPYKPRTKAQDIKPSVRRL